MFEINPTTYYRENRLITAKTDLFKPSLGLKIERNEYIEYFVTIFVYAVQKYNLKQNRVKIIGHLDIPSCIRVQ